jgi:hypothetical protein
MQKPAAQRLSEVARPNMMAVLTEAQTNWRRGQI